RLSTAIHVRMRVPGRLSVTEIAGSQLRSRLGGRGRPRHFAVAEQYDLIGEVEGTLDVLLDQQHGDARRTCLTQGGEHGIDEKGRQSERELVGHQETRWRGQHAGQAEHLLLAPAEGAGRLVPALGEYRKVMQGSTERGASLRARHRAAD